MSEEEKLNKEQEIVETTTPIKTFLVNLYYQGFCQIFILIKIFNSAKKTR